MKTPSMMSDNEIRKAMRTCEKKLYELGQLREENADGNEAYMQPALFGNEENETREWYLLLSKVYQKRVAF